MELIRFSHLSAGHTFKFREGLHPGELIPLDDFTWVQSHDQKMFCLFQEFAGEYQHRIRRVSHLPRLHQPGDHVQRIGKRTSVSWAWEAITSNLAAGCTTSISRMIVAASDVTNSLPRWLINNLFRPVMVPHRGQKSDTAGSEAT